MQFITWFAEEWASIYFLHMLETSVFVALIYFTDRLLSLETRMRYFLWLTALLKFFIPPFIKAPVGVQNPEAAFFLPTMVSADNIGKVISFPAITFSEVFVIIWLGAVLLFALIFILQNLKLRSYLKNAVQVRMSRHAFLQVTWKKPLVFVSGHLETPLLRGFSRPKLYLPADYQNWPPQRLKSILAHELAHFAYRDSWGLLLQCIAVVLFGLNPFVWLVHRKLLQIREIRCDETAIAQTGVSPTDYSKFLYSFIEKQSNPRTKPVFSGSYFAESKGAIMHRFKHLLSLPENGVVRRKSWHYVVMIILAAAIVPFSWQCQVNDVTILNPPAELEKAQVFQAYDNAPEPIGGFKAIQKNLEYPFIAKKAGIEGKVVVSVLVDEAGRVVETKILTSLGKSGCDEAAIKAVTSVAWKPARFEGKPVSVRVAIPVVFKLKPDHSVQVIGDFPPPSGEFDANIFVAYDSAPEPVGGFKAIQENLKFPKNDVFEEGRVFLNALVDADGSVVDTKVLKSMRTQGYDQAAMDAIKAVKWRPATQRGRPVRVWVGVPVVFKKE